VIYNGGKTRREIMSFRKILALIVCLAMLLTGVIGCKQDSETEQPGEGASGENPAEETSSRNDHGIDYEAAFASFPPDTVMIDAGVFTVTWAELFFYFRGNINEVFSYLGMLPEWGEEIYQGTSFAEFIIFNAVSDVLESKTIRYGAELLGFSLSDEDLQELIETFLMIAENYGGEEEFLRIIWENDGCYSREYFMSLMGLNRLIDVLFSELYGEDGKLISDESLVEHTEADGFLMTKHILRLQTEDDTARNDIEAIWRELNEYEGDDFDGFFDELMLKHSEDTGLAMSPEGYLFQVGDMVQEFCDTAVELEIGQFSEAVETVFGYHIIYRLPINFDVMPSSGYINNDYRTLRELVMMDMFSMLLTSWKLGLDIEYTDAYKSIDMTEVFPLSDS